MYNSGCKLKWGRRECWIDRECMNEWIICSLIKVMHIILTAEQKY